MSEIHNLKIEKLIYGGNGAGFIARMPVFVPMTVPGDEIECEIVRKHKGYVEGRILRIIRPSPNRVVPKCEHFGRCGGCQWQHVAYAAQILWKQMILEEQLLRIGKIKEPNVLPTIPSPRAWNYRSRIKLHKDKDGRTGFYAQGTRDLIEIEDCLIAGAGVKENGFTQVNPSQNENLKELIKLLVKETGVKTVLELYCGSGNLTFPTMDIVDYIEASDSDRHAIHSAVKLEKQGMGPKFTVESGKCTLERILKEKKQFDCLLVDPPRDGCKDILVGILRFKPPVIIYVSCNPSTLARYVGALIQGGYSLKSSQPIDMFPQTYHIESVSVLVAGPNI